MPKINKKLRLSQKLAKKIDGFLSQNEGELLFKLAKNCPPKTSIVEIGSWKGKSTVFLGLGSQSGNKNKVYAIDPHTGSPEHKKKLGEFSTLKQFKKNIKQANLKQIVVPIVKTSTQAAPSFNKKIGLLFIDGDHSYQMVKKDFQLWFPKIVNGGIIAFHDSNTHFDVKKTVNQFVFTSSNIHHLTFKESILYGQKAKKISLKDRFKNIYLFPNHSLYFLINQLPFRPPPFIIKIGKKISQLLQL